jgi:hypothetical protein
LTRTALRPTGPTRFPERRTRTDAGTTAALAVIVEADMFLTEAPFEDKRDGPCAKRAAWGIERVFVDGLLRDYVCGVRA